MKVYRQSDSTDRELRAHGCGAYAALNALAWASGGEYDPQGSATEAARYRVKVSGATDAQFNARGLTPDELAVSMHAVKATDERMDLPVRKMSGVDVRGELLPLLREGNGALVAVNYGTVQDAGKGVGSFRGGHWVFVFGGDGDMRVVVADPLRKQTVEWPWDLLVKAMERFGKTPWLNGRGEAIVVYPWQTWRKGYTKVKRDLAVAEKFIDAADARIRALEKDANVAAINALRGKVQTINGKLEALVDEYDAVVAPV